MIEVSVTGLPADLLRVALQRYRDPATHAQAPRSNQMLGVGEVASRFVRVRRTQVQEILETLTAVGQMRKVSDRYVI